MKTYKHLLDSVLNPQTVCKCTLDAAKGKLHRKDVQWVFRNFDKVYDMVVECATNPDYKPREDNYHEIIDGSHHKPREIEKPIFCPEQILHHMIVEPFKPILVNGLYEEVYGCLPKSVTVDKNGNTRVRKYGLHAAVNRLKKWVQIGKKVFVAETDVHHAYGSVNIHILMNKFRAVIKDENWLRLTSSFLKYDENDIDSAGLVLGHYTSPWFFNYYLKDFDHWAAKLEGIKYLRFADNMYFIGTNKRKVHKALEKARKYLHKELRLTLNSSTQIYRFEYEDKFGNTRGRAVNALGMVIHHDRVTLRKSILCRIRRKAIKISKKDNVTWHDAASMMSRLSWIKHTDTHRCYENYIRPLIDISLLKKKVRTHSKAILPTIEGRRMMIHDGLDKSSRLSGEQAAGIRYGVEPDYRVPA